MYQIPSNPKKATFAKQVLISRQPFCQKHCQLKKKQEENVKINKKNVTEVTFWSLPVKRSDRTHMVHVNSNQSVPGRFCPEDLRASVFSHRMEERVRFLKNTITGAIDGLQLLQVSLAHTIGLQDVCAVGQNRYHA